MPSGRSSIPLAEALIERFQATFTAPPPWAWPFKPSIPFIGHRFRPGRGILVYASAENFTWFNDAEVPRRFTTRDAWNRYRVQYEADGRGSEAFFPDVGIQPATDGGLLAAAWFVASRHGLPMAPRPREFLETIGVTNWCKVTIRPKRTEPKNVDYIGNLSKLTESLPFVVGELADLRPSIVLLPAKVWDRPVLQAAMRGASPRTLFVPVYQFNATVVNTRLASLDAPARRLRKRLGGTPLATWMENLHGFREANAWRYVAFLAQTLGHQS